jgi:protein subunit release factor B
MTNKPSKRGELIFSITKKDFEVQTFRSGGKGGQNQNKVESGVRIIHRDSGCVSEAREQRDQLQNKRIAFKRLTEQPQFKAWFKVEAAKRMMGGDRLRKINQDVDQMMADKNLKIEYF